MRNPALDAWGDYGRDDPYPLFAQVQADGPVHEVTLADGHRACLIVRHEEAKIALSHAGLSKDMHAALARDGAACDAAELTTHLGGHLDALAGRRERSAS